MLYDPKILLEELDLTKEEKEKIIQEVKKEFPNDEMLFELHIFRIVQYLKGTKKST